MIAHAPLRERQTELTKETILRALVEVIGKRGVHDFSVQKVADAAGVSHRTVYRHYPSREALLDGLNEWLGDSFKDKLGDALVGDAPRLAPEEIGGMAATAYRVFSENEALIDTFVTLSWGARLALSSRAKHTSWFEEWSEPATRHLPRGDARAVAAILRVLGSSTSWLLMRRASKASQGALERAVRWAVDTLIADLAAGGGPGRQTEEA